MHNDGSAATLVETYYRIEPGRFHYLKFILEGYDNLAVISAVSQYHGVVRLRCAAETLSELIVILAGLAPAIKRRQLR